MADVSVQSRHFALIVHLQGSDLAALRLELSLELVIVRAEKSGLQPHLCTLLGKVGEGVLGNSQGRLFKQ